MISQRGLLRDGVGRFDREARIFIEGDSAEESAYERFLPGCRSSQDRAAELPYLLLFLFCFQNVIYPRPLVHMGAQLSVLACSLALVENRRPSPGRFLLFPGWSGP